METKRPLNFVPPWLNYTLFLFMLSSTYALMTASNQIIGIFYIQFQDGLQATASQASLAIGLPTAMMFLGGVIYGALYNIVGYKISLVLSSLLVGFGYMLTALANSIQLAQFFMAVLLGPGGGMCNIASYSVAAVVFSKKRSLANSIISMAGTIGALFLGPLIQYLIDIFSWRWSMLILGAIVLEAIPTTMLTDWFYAPADCSKESNAAKQADDPKPEEPHREVVVSTSSEMIEMLTESQTIHKTSDSEIAVRKKLTFTKLLDVSVLRDVCFIWYMIAMSGSTMAVACMVFYLMRYAQDIGISDTDAVWLYSISRGLSMTSCILMGLATSYCNGSAKDMVNKRTGQSSNTASRVHTVGRAIRKFLSTLRRSYILVILQLCMALSLLIPTLSETYNSFLIYAIAGGIASGSIGALPITVLTDFFGVEKLPSALSFRSCITGIFVLGIPPLIGYLVDIYGSYRVAQYMCSGLAFLAATLTYLTQILLNRKGRRSGE